MEHFIVFFFLHVFYYCKKFYFALVVFDGQVCGGFVEGTLWEMASVSKHKSLFNHLICNVILKMCFKSDLPLSLCFLNETKSTHQMLSMLWPGWL